MAISSDIKFNFKELDPKMTTVTGRDYSIEDRTTGRVFVTRKEYINKLFSEMGYRNLGVINILEEFAGKIISDVGTLRSSSLWIDEMTDSFIVCSKNSKDNFNELFSELKQRGFIIHGSRKPDTYIFWDEYLIESPKGVKFALYFNMQWESVSVLSLHETDDAKLDGMINEGSWKMSEPSFISEIFVTLESPINASVGISPMQEMSLNEYVNLLTTLGYLKIKRGGKCYVTDEGEQMQDIIADFIGVADEYNLSNDLKRRVTPSGIIFKEAYDLISQGVVNIPYWEVRSFYINNSLMKSDLMLIE